MLRKYCSLFWNKQSDEIRQWVWDTKQMSLSINQILQSCLPHLYTWNTAGQVTFVNETFAIYTTPINKGLHSTWFSPRPNFRVAEKIWSTVPKLCAWLSFSRVTFHLCIWRLLTWKIGQNDELKRDENRVHILKYFRINIPKKSITYMNKKEGPTKKPADPNKKKKKNKKMDQAVQ